MQRDVYLVIFAAVIAISLFDIETSVSGQTIVSNNVYLPLIRVAPTPATATPQSTSTPNSTNTPLPVPPTTCVVIHYVFYDGIVPTSESDEYVEIVNNCTISVNMHGWRLNAGDTRQNFTFPNIILNIGQLVRVYTNEIHPESGGLSFNYGRAIWENEGDCGYLYDSEEVKISEYCYPN